MTTLLRWIRITAIVLLVAAACGCAAIAWLWQTRAVPEDLPLPVADVATAGDNTVTVTWLGIATLLFDDGETQVITDATFSRYSLAEIALMRPLESDIAQINYVLDEFRINRLAAIVPLHSHFDHAIDAGHVANRTGAMILGSESTANIARGSNVPVDQYQILQFGESRFFGDFTITLLESRHVAQLPNGDPAFRGVITRPLEQPAPVKAWKSGATYAVLIEHPAGTTLVQGSAGFIDGHLDGVNADVAILSIAGLSGRGHDYTTRYWQETVERTSASRVLAIHFDDFTYPFGSLALFPDLVDDAVTSSDWLRTLASNEDHPVEIARPPLAEPLALFELPSD